MPKKRLRHALAQDVAIFVQLIANMLFYWKFTPVNDTTKAVVKTRISSR